MRYILILLLIVAPIPAFSQYLGPELEEMMEQHMENDDVPDLEGIMEAYQNYLENPLNLNIATEEELRELRLLSEQQVCELIAYRKRYGQLLSVYELQAIRFFDIGTIYKILPYIIVAEQEKRQPALDQMLSKGRSSLMLRYSRILEEPQGYQGSSTDTAGYKGSPYRFYARYKFRFRDRMSFGFTGEKDPGEAFFRDPQKNGFDFYSAYLYYKPGKILNAIILGDYEVKIGQGLIIWNGFGYGKTSDALMIRRAANVLKPYTSVDENRFLRGAATTLKFHNYYLTTFISHKNIDATIAGVDDAGKPLAVSALVNTGLHRTANEMNGKNSIEQTVAGMNMKARFRSLDIGFSAIHIALSAPLILKDVAYNYYKFQGTSVSNFGFDYSYQFKGAMIFGETAISDGGGIATLNGVTTKLDHRTSVTVLQRYYQKNYHTLFGSAFSESGGVNNEMGIFIGMTTAISKKVRLEGYSDFFKHPWLKYLIDGQSFGTDHSARLVFFPNRKTEIYTQVKWEQKQKNEVDNKTSVDQPVSHIKKGIRLQAGYKPHSQVQLKSRLEFSFFNDKDKEPERGFLIFQEASYQFLKIPLKLSARYALFETDSWNTGIYAYEQDVLYAFSIPVHNEKGARYYLVANYKVSRNIELWGKIAQFYYPERSTIGTGRDQIEGNRKTDIKLQARMKI